MWSQISNPFPPWSMVIDAMVDAAFCLIIIVGAAWSATVAWKDLRAKRAASKLRENHQETPRG